MITGLQHYRCRPVDSLCGAQAGTDRLEHRRIRIARDAVNCTASQRRGDEVRFMPNDDHHLVTEGADCVVGGGHKRLRALG
jgi:hypothetical protein